MLILMWLVKMSHAILGTTVQKDKTFMVFHNHLVRPGQGGSRIPLYLISFPSNKKHRNPLNTEIRKEYHVQNKAFKKLIKYKKRQFFDSKMNELISNENNHKFWDTLKSVNENNLSYNNN